MKITTTCATLALTLGLGSVANAALVHAGTNGGSVTLVSVAGFGGVGTLATVTDGGNGSATISGASDGNNTSTGNGQVFTNDPGGFPSDYFGTTNVQAIVFDIDLGIALNLNSLAFWNRPGGNNAVQSFTATFSADATIDGSDTSINFTAGNANGDQQDLAMADQLGIQFVRIAITDNFFGAAGGDGGGDRVGFTEFQFNEFTPIPEPSSTALLGLGGLALILRRRK